MIAIRSARDRVLDRLHDLRSRQLTPVALHSVLGHQGLDLVPGRGGALRRRVCEECLDDVGGTLGLALGPGRKRLDARGDDCLLYTSDAADE